MTAVATHQAHVSLPAGHSLNITPPAMHATTGQTIREELARTATASHITPTAMKKYAALATRKSRIFGISGAERDSRYKSSECPRPPPR